MSSNEDEKLPCEYCGELFSPQGVSTHERYCDEAPDDDDSGEDDSELQEEEQTQEAPPDDSMGNELSEEFDLTAPEDSGEEGECDSCGSEENLTVHTVHTTDYVLCGSCVYRVEKYDSDNHKASFINNPRFP